MMAKAILEWLDQRRQLRDEKARLARMLKEHMTEDGMTIEEKDLQDVRDRINVIDDILKGDEWQYQ